VVSCLGLLAAVLALNAAIDPFATVGTGLFPPAIESDRSTKLTLLEDLSEGPEILILGSSRARQAEAAFLEQLTGRTAFNAAVTGGTAADAWAMTRFAADRFPDQRRRYLWFIDVGVATNGVNRQLRSDPRAGAYLLEGGDSFGLEDVGTYIGTQATRASLRVFRACALGPCRGSTAYLPDGSITAGALRSLPEHARSLDRSVESLVARIRVRPPSAQPLKGARTQYFERTLAFMNEHGARPVIVLNPIHPAVLAELERSGFGKREAALEYLGALHARFDFALVDCQDIRDWGGSAGEFSNATHVNRRNMRRMLRYILAHSDGALA
jgi:hypothetical protein